MVTAFAIYLQHNDVYIFHLMASIVDCVGVVCTTQAIEFICDRGQNND